MAAPPPPPPEIGADAPVVTGMAEGPGGLPSSGPGALDPSAAPAGAPPPVEEPEPEPALKGRLGQGMRDADGGDKNRKPPGGEGSFSRLFYNKKGPPIVFEKRLSFREKMKAFWVTKQMVDEVDDIELRLRVTVAELALFIIYVVILGVVIHGDHSHDSYYIAHSMSRQYVHTKFKTPSELPINLKQVKSASDVWAYLNFGLIDSVFWEYYYHREDRIQELTLTDRNSLYENVIIGRVKLRTIKVRKDSCEIHHSFRRLFSTCYGYYTMGTEDEEAWIHKHGEPIWSFERRPEEKNTEYRGTFALYGSFGFHEILRETGAESKTLLTKMKEYHWITQANRVQFIDFTAFNTQVNLFVTVKIVFELPPTGGAYASYSIIPTKMFAYIWPFDYFLGGVEMTFVFFVIFHLVEEIREILYFGSRYFYMTGNLVDLLQTVQAFYSCAFLGVRALIYERQILKLVRKTRGGFCNLEELIYWQWLYTKFTATLYFQAIIKLFKYLHFTPYMSQLVLVVQRSAKDILGFLVLFFLVYAAFSQLGYLLFGTQVDTFRTYIESAYTLLNLIMGSFDYMKVEQADRILGPIYFMCFVFFIFFVLLNMFLAIMNETYVQARQGRLIGAPPRIAMEKYLARGLYNISKCLKKPTKLMQERKQAKRTILAVKKALMRNNFTINEINMFFAKYGIDGKKTVECADIHKILKDFERKGLWPTQPPRLDDIRLKRDRAYLDDDILLKKMDKIGWTGLTIKDYDALMARLEAIEAIVEKMAERAGQMIVSLDIAEKHLWRKKKRLTIKKKAADDAKSKEGKKGKKGDGD